MRTSADRSTDHRKDVVEAAAILGTMPGEPRGAVTASEPSEWRSWWREFLGYEHSGTSLRGDLPEQLSIEISQHGYALIHSGAIRYGGEPTTSVLTFTPPAGGLPVSIVVAAYEGTIYIKHSPIYENVSRAIEDVLARYHRAELEARRSKDFWRKLFARVRAR